MTYSPCESCEKDERCTTICNDFIRWFIPAWDEMAARLREKWGLKEEAK